MLLIFILVIQTSEIFQYFAQVPNMINYITVFIQSLPGGYWYWLKLNFNKLIKLILVFVTLRSSREKKQFFLIFDISD